MLKEAPGGRSSQESQVPATNATDLVEAPTKILPQDLLLNIIYHLPNEEIWSLRSQGMTLKSLGDKAMALKLLDELEASFSKSLQTGWDKANYARKIQIACVMRSVANDSRFAEIYCELSDIADAHLEKRDFYHPILLRVLIPFTSEAIRNQKIGPYKNTILHKATEFLLTDVVQALLKEKVDVSIQNSMNKTALHLAVETGRIDLIKTLLKSGAKVDVQDNLGRTVLHFAAMYCQPNAMSTLLAAGAKVDDQDNEGHTALHKVLIWGKPAKAKLLIKSNASLDIRDKLGRTPRMLIMRSGDLPLLDLVARRERSSSLIVPAFEAMRLDEANQGDGPSGENQVALNRRRLSI